ncbi:MAG: baseplate J/gp47 family protein [Clostridium sp.]|nr:baseplate J/gp47 family protein [Clostridium sp.]
MKTAYYNEYGSAVEEYSETMKRFEMLAAELYAISCYGDYILKQGFVQTATGENLDKLGELRGCCRKTQAGARGILIFSIDEVSDTEIVIPKGTVCSVKGKPFIQFATEEESVIAVGKQSVAVSASALADGEAYNASAGEISVMVNAPVGVSRVTNEADFTGGCNTEDDASYRSRIIRHYNILPNGMNSTSFENLVMTLDYITDCCIPYSDSPGSIQVFVATKDGSLTELQMNEIKTKLSFAELVGMIVYPEIAKVKDYSLTVSAKIMSGFDKNNVASLIESKVKAAVSKNRIGRAVSLSAVSRELNDIDGLLYFSFDSDNLVGNEIYCDSGSILHLKDLAVSCSYE